MKPKKCGKHARTYCPPMKMALGEDQDPSQKGMILGFSVKLVGKKNKMVRRLAYRTAKGRSGAVIYLNCCPWCLTPFNEDLQT